jgi:branched-chain amino acid aminotransferase
MKIIKTQNLKAKPTDTSKLGFGKIFTDYMFTMRYDSNEGWHDAQIEPYKSFQFDPSTTILHYAQGIFDGLKAFKNDKDEIRIFRPMENMLRLNRSAERMCIPNFDVNVAMEGLKELINLEKEWIPTAKGTALYIRPTIIATDAALGVHASHSYIFYIILSPVGSYYANGLKPTKIFVEDFYVRSAVGGTGEAKCMGNYAASLIAGEKANKLGFDQVLWLDAKENKYAEEVGSMNMFFVIGNEVITPMLTGSILPGITRKSIIEILKKYGYKITERKISIDEIIEAANNGKLNEAFGTGTAAVVSPVGLIQYKGIDYKINNEQMGEITSFLYDTLTGIQTGIKQDEFNWVTKL